MKDHVKSPKLKIITAIASEFGNSAKIIVPRSWLGKSDRLLNWSASELKEPKGRVIYKITDKGRQTIERLRDPVMAKVVLL